MNPSEMSEIMNVYKNGIDFLALAQEDDDFAKFLISLKKKSKNQLDFSDPDAVLQLTKSLLRRDFGLSISLPSDRLCPPVPIRLNYILWIRGLLDTTTIYASPKENIDPNSSVLGIDIGTGASCIYPMLGCIQNKNWSFIGTDIDEKSLQYASLNIKSNKLEDRIKLIKTDSQDSLFPLQSLGLERVNFCMCNPPFYGSKAEMLMSAASKKRPPYTVCTGSDVEMVTVGGEVAFISRMIDESLVSRNRIQWYTSMLGKFSNLALIQEKLNIAGIDNFAMTEFVQGNKTKRWAIAWSFDDLRPSLKVARGLNGAPKSIQPFPSTYHIMLVIDLTELVKRVNSVLSHIPVIWKWDEELLTGIGFCEKDIWSRAARRQKKERVILDHQGDDQNKITECKLANKLKDMAFGFKIHIDRSPETTSCNQVVIRWIKGHDSKLFESFCGMMRRNCSI